MLLEETRARVISASRLITSARVGRSASFAGLRRFQCRALAIH
jgi:hypothetical protein